MTKMKKEIGGYIELEHYRGGLYHENAVVLNCGRAALEYLIRAKGIKHIYLPYFCCDSVSQPCEKNHVKVDYYHIDEKFRPVFETEIGEGEWLYIVNFYGQISNAEIRAYKERYKRVIVDNAQAYFQMPVPDTDTLYTCRKFFGVTDGAFLYTDTFLDERLDKDESYNRMFFLLGRFEHPASEFYESYVENNKIFIHEPVKRMSALTENLLRAIDYKEVKQIRTQNFTYLNQRLGKINRLPILEIPDGAFMYPLYFKGAHKLRKILADEKIYIPTLWPNVLKMSEDTMEYKYALDILPLPCDQRYGLEDMKHVCIRIFEKFQ